jgi:hypothetical protein
MTSGTVAEVASEENPAKSRELCRPTKSRNKFLRAADRADTRRCQVTERCDGLGTRRAGRASYEEAASEPSAEDIERKREREQPTQAAGDARRDDWIAGMSRDAASTPAPRPPTCDGPTPAERAREESERRSREMHMASRAHTAKTDRPLEDDPIGNAIPGLVAGGIAAGAHSAGASAGHFVTDVAKHAALHVAADVIHHAAEHGAHAIGKRVGDASLAPESPPPKQPPSAPATAAAGRSGSRAVSEPAEEPAGKSEVSPPVGRDAIPYRPGYAPVRIPEAIGPADISIQG